MMTKEQVTKELLDWHFLVAPDIVKVYRFLSDNETSDDEPIKLLEVSQDTVATGTVTPFGFAKTEEIPYPTVIALVRPEEMEQIEKHMIRLPRGWRLDSAQEYLPPADARPLNGHNGNGE